MFYCVLRFTGDAKKAKPPSEFTEKGASPIVSPFPGLGISVFEERRIYKPRTIAGEILSVLDISRACLRVGSDLPDRISLIFDWFIPRSEASLL